MSGDGIDWGSPVWLRLGVLIASRIQHDGFIEGFGIALTTDAQAESGSEGVRAIPGLVVAGNAAKGLQLAMVAAAEGLKAAHGINSRLPDLNRKAADPITIQPYGLKP